MKKLLPFLFLFLLASPSGAASGEEPTGREIMEKSFARDDGSDVWFRIEMLLTDKNGRERKRLLEIQTKDYGKLLRTCVRFLSPPDIENTAFLTWENEDADDTQYLYLPELGRARRIVGSQKNLRFVNTDFTYEDMQRRRPEQDEHRRQADGEWQGRSCWVIECLPREGTSQYGKRICWVDRESLVVVKTEFYNRKGEKTKELLVEKLEKRPEIWTIVQTVMRDLKEKHRTVLAVTEVKYNQGINDEVFRPRFLENR